MTDVYRKGKYSFDVEPLVGHVTRVLESKGKVKRKRMFASSAGWCARQNVLTKLAPEDMMSTMGASSQFYFSIGNAVHETLERAFKKARILIDAEIPVNMSEVNMGGRIDYLLIEDGNLVIADAKTCGKIPARPKYQQPEQLMTYGLMSGIERLKLIYFSRNVASWDGRLYMKTFDVIPDIKKVTKVIARGHVYAQEELIPERPWNAPSRCGFCPFTKFCFDEVKEDNIFTWTGEGAPSSSSYIKEKVEKEALLLAKKLYAGRKDRRRKIIMNLLDDNMLVSEFSISTIDILKKHLKK